MVFVRKLIKLVFLGPQNVKWVFVFVDFRRESNSSRKEKLRVSLAAAAPVKRISWNRFLSTRFYLYLYLLGLVMKLGIGFMILFFCVVI